MEDRYCLLNELMAFLGDEEAEDDNQVQDVEEQGIQDAGVNTAS